MWKNISLNKCISFIESQVVLKGKPSSAEASARPAATIPRATGPGGQQVAARPAVTISRETGAGGHTVASNLADYLQMHVPSYGVWTVFDQNLVEKVLEDHHIQKHIADFMHEGHKSMIADSVEEWIGLHPSSWTLVQQTNATILRLAQIGNVILVGRGATVITSKLKNVFHVRLVGSLEKRIERVERVYELDRKSAINFIKTKDEGRKRYLKDNFDADVESPLLYHVTINTDLVRHDEAARLIGDEVIARFNLGSHIAAGSGNRAAHQ